MTGKEVEECPGGMLAFVAAGLPYGRQLQSGGERDGVVEGNNRQIVGNEKTESSGGPDYPFGYPVAQAQQGRRTRCAGEHRGGASLPLVGSAVGSSPDRHSCPVDPMPFSGGAVAGEPAPGNGVRRSGLAVLIGESC